MILSYNGLRKGHESRWKLASIFWGLISELMNSFIKVDVLKTGVCNSRPLSYILAAVTTASLLPNCVLDRRGNKLAYNHHNVFRVNIAFLSYWTCSADDSSLMLIIQWNKSKFQTLFDGVYPVSKIRAPASKSSIIRVYTISRKDLQHSRSDLGPLHHGVRWSSTSPSALR